MAHAPAVAHSTPSLRCRSGRWAANSVGGLDLTNLALWFPFLIVFVLFFLWRRIEPAMVEEKAS